jgi:hypothetical protein
MEEVDHLAQPRGGGVPRPARGEDAIGLLVEELGQRVQGRSVGMRESLHGGPVCVVAS